MEKIAYCTEKEIADGKIPERILHAVRELGGEAAVSEIISIVGGIGGGWDDPSVPPASGREFSFIDREQIVHKNKMDCLVDFLNGDADHLRRLFQPRLK